MCDTAETNFERVRNPIAGQALGMYMWVDLESDAVDSMHRYIQ